MSFDDDRTLGLGEIAFRSTFSAAVGGLCGATFGQGCLIAAGGLRSGTTVGAGGLAGFRAGKVTQTAIAGAVGRTIPAVFFVSLTLLKSGLTHVFFDDGSC